MSENSENSQKAKSDYLDAFAWLCAVIAFSPAIYWLGDGLVKSSQLRDAFIILVAMLLFIAFENNIKPHKPVFTRISLFWLGVAYVVLFTSKFFGQWSALAILAGLASAIISFGLAAFSKKRYAYAAGGAFYTFTILSIVMKEFDLPLRVWAGVLSAKILGLFDKSVSLLADSSGGLAQIAMMVDGKPFLVATECNGFGLISSSIVLAMVFAIFSTKIPLLIRILMPILAGVFAYLVNSFRIVTIVILAPMVGDPNYFVMHEVIGYFYSLSALFLIFIFCSKFFSKSKDALNSRKKA